MIYAWNLQQILNNVRAEVIMKIISQGDFLPQDKFSQSGNHRTTCIYGQSR